MGDLKSVELLVQYGADPEALNHRNDTPNSIAIAKQEGAIVKSFNTRYDYLTPRTKEVANNGIRVTIAKRNHYAEITPFEEIPFEQIPFEDIPFPLGMPEPPTPET